MNRVLHLKNKVSDLEKLTEWIEALSEEAGLTPDKLFQLNLAMEEAVVNVMKYAYPGQSDMPIDVEAEISPDSIRIIIDDSGVPFDPTEKPNPDITLSAEDRPIGGLGIMLVRQLMQEVTYEYKDGHNRLHLTMTSNP